MYSVASGLAMRAKAASVNAEEARNTFAGLNGLVIKFIISLLTERVWVTPQVVVATLGLFVVSI